MLSDVWGELQRAAGAMERLVELLEVEPQIKAPENPVELPDTREGRICFEHVSFSYPSRPGILAMGGFSLDIAPGEKICHIRDIRDDRVIRRYSLQPMNRSFDFCRNV